MSIENEPSRMGMGTDVDKWNAWWKWYWNELEKTMRLWARLNARSFPLSPKKAEVEAALVEAEKNKAGLEDDVSKLREELARQEAKLAQLEERKSRQEAKLARMPSRTDPANESTMESSDQDKQSSPRVYRRGG